MDIKVKEIVKYHENDFFLAYKNKMYTVMREMRQLKDKASTQRMKAK